MLLRSDPYFCYLEVALGAAGLTYFVFNFFKPTFMNGLIFDYQLTIPTILRRAETFFGHKEIVSRLPDRNLHRTNYEECAVRARKLALALQRLGIRPGDRVGTFCWNHSQHLEIYLGVPSFCAVLHTLNLRLAADDLIYIVNHGGDRAIIVDEVLLPLFEKFRSQIKKVEFIIVIPNGSGQIPAGMLDYEKLLAAEDATKFKYSEFDENLAAAMCYTSGTTGKPKGVLYSHRAITLHSMASGMTTVLGVGESDTVLPVVPMFHVNAWGLPFTCAMVGAKLVFPGPFLDPTSLLELYESEKVTFTAGVPTIWFGILQLLDKEPRKYNLQSLRTLLVGGSAAPKAMIQGFQERHNLRVVHAWGMTETAPLGSVANLTSELLDAPAAAQYDFRAKQGIPAPFVEIRARSDQGFIPWDGISMGELEVRGPWIASHYYNTNEMEERFTPDGWFCTGDIVSINSKGCIQIQDRSKDVIKSGGEWISSVALESMLMSHPSVLEAAVIAIAHPKWGERPLAAVVLKENKTATPQELIDFLRPHFDKTWMPDAVEFVKAIPRTGVGKFQKTVLREQFKDYKLG